MSINRKISWYLSIVSAVFVVVAGIMPFFMFSAQQIGSAATMLTYSAILKNLFAIGVLIVGYWGFKRGLWMYAGLAAIGALKSLYNLYSIITRMREAITAMPDVKNMHFLHTGLTIVITLIFAYFYGCAFIETLKQRKHY